MEKEIRRHDKKLFVISGSSGVGKGTVIGGFLNKHPNFKLSISCTTREKRVGEVEGVNYFYLSKEEFHNSVENGDFLEWEEFSGNFYGTKKEFILNSLAKNRDLILEIDTKGAFKVKKQIPDAVLIFIAPPCCEELEQRLRNRKTETEEAIQKRLQAVNCELQNSKRFDYVVVNDEVEKAISALEKIIKGENV